MYKRPFIEPYTPAPPAQPGVSPGDDAPSFISGLTQAIPALVPAVVTALINSQYQSFSKVIGTHGEIFSNTDVHGKVLSSAIGVHLNDVLRVNDVLISLNESNGPFAGVVAFRYVKGTDAILGFTRFPVTCVVELDGLFSNDTLAFLNAFWDALEAESIPFTFHWGKLLTLTKARLRQMYTDACVDQWLDARSKLMPDADCRRVFTNDFMTELGLG